MSGFDISKESFDSDYCKVAEGVYVLSERHAPGGATKFFPVINNRGFIFCVKNDQGQEHLLLQGIPGNSCIPKARQVEKETGLKLTLIVGSGDFHHMSMKDWLDEFPEVKIVHSGLKFLHTRNGKEILENPDYKARIELVEGPNIPSLEQYIDVVRFYGFNQFITGADLEWTSKDNKTPMKQESYFSFLRKFGSIKPTEKFLCVWTYHVPTKTLVYEHNFNFYITKEHMKEFRFLFRVVLPKEKICSCAKEQLPTGPKDIESCREHCQQMSRILDLDVRAMMEYHSLPGAMAGRWESKEAFQTEFTNILKKTGEHIADGTAMVKALNKSCFLF